MARTSLSRTDPSTDAAALLRRLGFAVLAIGVPLAALAARRGVVVGLPVGAMLLVLSAVIDGDARPLRATLARLGTSWGFLAGIGLIGWAVLSLAWTPNVLPAGERLFATLAVLLVALAAFMALPDRMRSANLYLVPVGTAMAATALVAVALAGSGAALGGDGEGMSRGLSLVTLFVWPSIAWLRSRGRDGEAISLAVLVAVAAASGPHPVTTVALGLGAIAYAAAALLGRRSAIAIGLILGGLVLIAPLVPFAMPPVAGLGRRSGVWLEALASWRTVIALQPERLVTGHGFGSLQRGAWSTLVPVLPLNTPLLRLWYELGVVGAIGVAATLWASAARAVQDHANLLPGAMAAFVTGAVVACSEQGAGQSWLTAALCVLVLLFVAIERGQFRTRRPRAAWSGGRADRSPVRP